MTCVLVRREWLAVTILTLIQVVLVILASPLPWFVVVAMNTIAGVSLFLVARRYGLLSLYAFFFCSIITEIPLTAKFSAWYAGNAWFVAAVLLALAIYAFYTSLGGQKVFAGNLLDE